MLSPVPSPPVPSATVRSVPTADAGQGTSGRTIPDAEAATAPRPTEIVVPPAPEPSEARVASIVRTELSVPAVHQTAGTTAAVDAASTPTAPTAHTASRQVAPLPHQLGSPVLALARAVADAPGGTSVITVTVAPDDLGPITIRASLSAEGTRIEFFSTTDGGREALRQSMPELRREASSSGLSASLDLGSGTPGDRQDTPRAESRLPARPAALVAVLDADRESARARDHPTSALTTLDLFA
ncbi:flagellar hook-length control protein FliK [Arthrobacter echini]|uniref:flagellar hook-length control protein FliK n=1 Tax=Arthrobacter echini TaxID=1529066 RepID=UPI001455E0F2|nr:flagellar hook-length control protein FliK [Arthrobacter echini]